MSLDEIQEELGDQVKLIMDTLDKNILSFFTQALQLDKRTLNMESREQSCSLLFNGTYLRKG